MLFQTFPGASRTGIHNEGLLQRVDAHSHVRRDWGKNLMMDVVIVNIISFMLIIIFSVILVNLYNFISGIGYCPFLSFSSNSPPQPAQPGHFGNFGAMALILQKSVFNLFSFQITVDEANRLVVNGQFWCLSYIQRITAVLASPLPYDCDGDHQHPA